MQITICDKCPCLHTEMYEDNIYCTLPYETIFDWKGKLSYYSEDCKLESIKHDGIEFIPEKREI